MWSPRNLGGNALSLTHTHTHTHTVLVCYISLNKPVLQPDSLVDNIKFDHGYTAKSPAIVNVSALYAFQYLNWPSVSLVT